MHTGQISVWLVVHFPGALLISGGNQKEITVRPHCTLYYENKLTKNIRPTDI